MDCRLGELCSKELIDISDGTRYGFVNDLELDPENVTVHTLALKKGSTLMNDTADRGSAPYNQIKGQKRKSLRGRLFACGS